VFIYSLVTLRFDKSITTGFTVSVAAGWTTWTYSYNGYGYGKFM